MWYTYTMEYLFNHKKNEIVPFATTWIDLEGITLSERSQTILYLITLYVKSTK